MYIVCLIKIDAKRVDFLPIISLIVKLAFVHIRQHSTASDHFYDGEK